MIIFGSIFVLSLLILTIISLVVSIDIKFIKLVLIRKISIIQ